MSRIAHVASAGQNAILDVLGRLWQAGQLFSGWFYCDASTMAILFDVGLCDVLDVDTITTPSTATTHGDTDALPTSSSYSPTDVVLAPVNVSRTWGAFRISEAFALNAAKEVLERYGRLQGVEVHAALHEMQRQLLLKTNMHGVKSASKGDMTETLEVSLLRYVQARNVDSTGESLH